MNFGSATRDLVEAAGRAARLHALVRGLECLAAGVLGGAVVFAAGLASGASAGADLVAVSVPVGLMTAALAWRERPPRASDVARRADRDAQLDGALAAVLDRARRDDGARAAGGSQLAALLAHRVRAAVRPVDLLKAALPRSPLVLAAPLLAGALVVLALERRPASAPEPVSKAAAGLRAAAEQSRAVGALAPADALEAAARRVESVERQEAGRASPPDGSERERAAADLERLAASLPESEPARAVLEDPARALARIPGSGPRSASPSRPVERGAGGDPGGGKPVASAGSGAPAGADGSAGLANAPGEGRMFGPPAGGESDPKSGGPTSGTAATGGTGRGVLSARWWPSRYDAVVERYLTP